MMRNIIKKSVSDFYGGYYIQPVPILASCDKRNAERLPPPPKKKKLGPIQIQYSV